MTVQYSGHSIMSLSILGMVYTGPEIVSRSVQHCDSVVQMGTHLYHCGDCSQLYSLAQLGTATYGFADVPHPYHIGTINPQPTLATRDDGIWAPLYLRDFVISAHSYYMGLCNSSPPMSDGMT